MKGQRNERTEVGTLKKGAAEGLVTASLTPPPPVARARARDVSVPNRSYNGVCRVQQRARVRYNIYTRLARARARAHSTLRRTSTADQYDEFGRCWDRRTSLPRSAALVISEHGDRAVNTIFFIYKKK